MIIAYIGDIGSGKTLSVVKQLYTRYIKGYDIYTNFGLDFPEDKKHGTVTSLDKQFFSDYTKSEFNIIRSQIAIDEAHVFFDSRNAMMKKNKIFSKFITQSRKRSVDLYYTTQDKSPYHFIQSGQVELRLRKLTDYIIFCESHKIKGKTFIINNIYDRYGCLMNKNIYQGDKYFKLYDTNQIIDFD